MPCLNVLPLEPSATNDSDRGFAVNALPISDKYEVIQTSPPIRSSSGSGHRLRSGLGIFRQRDELLIIVQGQMNPTALPVGLGLLNPVLA